MDIEWLLLLCIPVVVKVPYITYIVMSGYLPTYFYPKNKWKLTPGPTSKKCFFLHPFWMELTLSTDDTVLTRS